MVGGVYVSSLASVLLSSRSGILHFLGCPLACHLMRRLRFGIDVGLSRPPHLEKDMVMESLLVRTSLWRMGLVVLVRVLLCFLTVDLSIRGGIGPAFSHNILSGRLMH